MAKINKIGADGEVGSIVFDSEHLPGRVMEKSGDEVLVLWRDGDQVPVWTTTAHIWDSNIPRFASFKQLDRKYTAENGYGMGGYGSMTEVPDAT